MSDPAPPTDEPRPGNWDKAWNDPPLFSYQATSAKAAESSGLKLNKRVGFPSTSATPMPAPPSDRVGSAPPLSTPLPDAGAKSAGGVNRPPPPPPAALGPAPPLGPPPPITADQSKAPSKESKAKIVVYDCDRVVELLKTSLTQSSLDEKKSQDIQKRIDMMASKWKAGVLNQPVQTGMGRIADLLAAQDAASAEKIQLSLMVDWPALCGTWLVGIKHLIVNLKEGQKSPTTS